MKPTRFYSKKQEMAVAKQVAGARVVNSGATPFQKGDVRTEGWLIECKTTTTQKKSVSIKNEWLEKNREEAFAMGKWYSALCIDFGPDTARYYVIDEPTFKKLIQLTEDERRNEDDGK